MIGTTEPKGRTSADVVQFSTIAARCAASTDPLLWAEVWACVHDVERLERDAVRVTRDVDALPQHDPLANALGLHWWESVLRRRAESVALLAKLDRLARVSPEVYADAASCARECGTRWVEVSGGSKGDGG